MSGDNFYEGADYGFDPEYGGFSQAYSSVRSSNISLATDARVANQLKATTEKLNTGAKAVEVSIVSADIFEAIPKQHFKELNRLRKLVGDNVELTLHAPLVEPTGISKQGWNPYDREKAEMQMIDAIEKANDLNPKGNVVTTFHASVAGPPAEIRVWEGEEGKKKEVIKQVVVVNEETGGFQALPIKPSYLEMGEGKEIDIQKKTDEINHEIWYRDLQHVNYAAEQGARIVENGLGQNKEILKDAGIDENIVLKSYKAYAEGKAVERLKALEKVGPQFKEIMEENLQTVTHGDIYLRDAYNGFKSLFDKAYSAAERSNSKEDQAKLDEFRKKIAPKLNYLENPEKVNELAETIREGVHVLRSLKKAPEQFKPLKNFALEKASETFGNVALHSFKKFGENSPIISTENHPAMQAILTSGEDLKELIETTREKFARKAVKEMKISEHEAKKQAEKLIGATWDVGHINQLRGYGAGEKELRKEAKAIAPYVKHIHLSDNFGLENVELPMGMGNVPKETFKLLKEQAKNFEKIKKVVEVGNWYQHFQTTPFSETLMAFGSPIYAPGSGSYWGPQGYFAGFGSNPDVHHAMYGSGFANLPLELGGQMSGRSRVSGNPLE